MFILKLSIFLLSSSLVLCELSLEQQACISSITIHNQPFCRFNDTIAQIYLSPEAYCTDPAVTVYDSLKYFKVAPFITCIDDHSVCYSVEVSAVGSSEFVVKNITVNDTRTTCAIPVGENCYRDAADTDNFRSIFTENIIDQYSQDMPACCLKECESNNNLRYGGCASNNSFYNDLETFCTDYCNDRSLKIVPCGQSESGIDCSANPQCPSSCILNAPVTAVCGSDNMLYSNPDDLCNALQSQTISDYYTCDGGCTQDDCDAKKCLNFLKSVNYDVNTICGDSGTFYRSKRAYCIAYYQKKEFIFFLCDKSACTVNYDCCYKKCSLSTPESLSFCSDQFNFYDNRDDYCDALCQAESMPEHLCSSEHCTTAECCRDGCNQILGFITCNATDGTLFTRDDYCVNDCGQQAQPTVENCYNSDNEQIDCTQIECNFKNCVQTNYGLYGDDKKVCGQSQSYYNNLTDYCTAVSVDAESGYLLCNDGVCAEEKDCRYAFCIYDTPMTSDESYCNQSGTMYYSREDLCKAYSENTDFDTLMCPPENSIPCDARECCQAACDQNQQKIVCGSDFTLVTTNETCKEACDSDNPTIYPCEDRDCTEANCALIECKAMMGDYPEGGVCSVNNARVSFFPNIDTFCMTFLSGQVMIPFKCDNGPCSSELECKMNLCGYVSSLFGPICGSNNKWYTSDAEYCFDRFTQGVKVQSCPNKVGLHLPCDEVQCCTEKCGSDILYSACNTDYYRVESAKFRCEYRCRGEQVDRPDLIVDECYDEVGNKTECTDCRPFKCEDQTEPYEYDSICIYNKSKEGVYYDSKQKYCDTQLAKDKYEFTPRRAIPCGSDAVPEQCEGEKDCCIAACIKRENTEYRDTCGLQEFEVLNLNDFCENYCSETLEPTEDCTKSDERFSCVQNDCILKKCLLDNNGKYGTVCLSDDSTEQYFYTSQTEYCLSLIEEGKTCDFDISEKEIGCPNGESVEACAVDSNCCHARCMLEQFYVGCSNENLDKIDHDSFCSYRCSPGNTERHDIHLRQCYSSTLEQEDCTDCEFLKCLDKIDGYQSFTICIDNENEGQFYTNHFDYCKDKTSKGETDYYINNDIQCNGKPCMMPQECCFEACMDTPNFKTGCEFGTNIFIDLERYCKRRCLHTAPELEYCRGRECTFKECAMRKCMNESTPTFKKICISNEVNGKTFFNNQEEYCRDKISAKESDYDNLHEVYCQDDGRCPDKDTCCHHVCLADNYKNSCSLAHFSVMSLAESCALKCNTESVIPYNAQVYECSLGPIPRSCSPIDCKVLECIGTFSQVYGSNPVCDNSDLFYGSVETYCKLRLGDMSKTTLCNEQPCSNDANCCTANCFNRNDFQPSCDAITFNYYSDQNSYCQAYCGFKRLMPLYHMGNTLASPEECCTKRCVLSNGGGDAVCDGTTYQLLTGILTCANECITNPNVIPCDKDGGCTQEDCNILACEAQFVKSQYIGTKVCGSDNKLYDDKSSFCEAITGCAEKPVVVICNNQACESEESCCIANCEIQHSSIFVTGCNVEFRYFDDVTNFCTFYCQNDQTFEYCLNDEGLPCDEKTCAENDCLRNDYKDVCTSDINSSLVTKETYCHELFNNPDYESQIYRCDNCGCSQDDCYQHACVLKNQIPFEDNPVCGRDMNLYDNVEAFCNAVQNNLVSFFFLCGGYEICESQDECCSEACLFNNPSDSFVGRCDQEYAWYSDSIDYCDAKCNTSTAYTGDYLCDDQFCDKATCDYELCVSQPYEGYCKANYDYISAEDYCNDFYTNPPGDLISCSDGCDSEKCAIEQCKSNLSCYKYTSICQIVADGSNLRGFTYHSDVASYCSEIAPDDVDAVSYSITSDVGCSDGTASCGSSLECCKQICKNNNPHDMCKSADFSVVTSKDYCDYFCGENDPIAIPGDRCSEQSGDIDCTDCSIFKCKSEISSYEFDKVCALIDDVATNYASQDAFCEAAVDSKIIENFVSITRTCNSSSCSEECGNDASCCKVFCLEDNSSYTNKCNTDDYSVYGSNEYCDDFCANTSTPTEECFGSCQERDCEIKQCISESNHSAGTSICLVDDRSSDFFFENITDFCGAEVDRCSPSYDLSGANVLLLCTGSPCADDIECCKARCLSETNFDTCDTSNSSIITPEQFCSYRCAKRDLSTLTIVDKVVFKCNDGCEQKDCDADTCNKESCKATNIPTYGTASICGSSGTFYTDVSAYCDAYLANGEDDIECANNELCTSDSECCEQACFNDDDQSFIPSCSTAEYKWRATTNKYCSEKCRIGSFTFYDIESARANQDECCAMRCTIEKPTLIVCSLDDFKPTTIGDSCDDLCNNDDESYHKCGDADCDQTDCDIEKCISDNGGENASNFCIRLGTYYETSRDLCVAIAPDFEIDTVEGSFDSCTGVNECCKQNCKLDNESFTGGCSTTFSMYTSVDQYCEDKCENNTELRKCGSVNCTLQECCEQNTDYASVCSPSPSFDLMTQQSYCDALIADTDFSTKVTTCAGGCVADDCTKLKCEYTVDLVFDSDGTICGSDSTQYTTTTDFCASQILNSSLTFTLCSGTQVCNDVPACCKANCLNNISDPYVPRCNGEHVWLATADEYCTSYCMADYTDYLCGSNPTDYCDRETCCKNKCNSSFYDPECSPTFTLLAQADYCDLYCEDGYVPNQCDGGCTQSKCDIKNCENANDLYSCKKICLSSTTLSTDYYGSFHEYCEAATTDSNFVYTIDGTNFIGCNSEEGCESSSDCCSAKCQIADPYDKCSKADHKIITSAEYCDLSCTTYAPDVDICMHGPQATSCSNCNYFKCMDDLANYSLNKICAHKNNVFGFYDSKHAFCSVFASIITFDYESPIIYCRDDSGNIDCPKEEDCCYKFCIESNILFTNVCNIDNLTVYGAENFCQDLCGNTITPTFGCGDGPCDISDCLVKHCIDIVGNDLSKICLTDQIAGSYFYESVGDACASLVQILDTNYSIVNTANLYSGVFAMNTPKDCCIARCLTETFYKGCSVSQGSLVDQATFCNYRCTNNDPESLELTDLNLEQCSTNNSLRDCITDECSILLCEFIFFFLGYSGPGVCMKKDKEFSETYFYEDYSAFCEDYVNVTKKIIPPLKKLSDCETGACDSLSDCCASRVCSDELYVGCDADNELITPADYCDQVCAAPETGLIPVDVKYCGSTDCTTCDIFTCLSVLDDYTYDTICLSSPIFEQAFYPSKEAYCSAFVEANPTSNDYELQDGKYLLCSDAACDESTCCDTQCSTTTFYDVCTSSFNLYTDSENFCSDKCSNTLTNIGKCYTDATKTQQKNCSQIDCCIADLVSNDLSINVCGNDGSIYSTAAEFCNQKNGLADFTTLDYHTCDDGCGNTECSEEACYLNYCNNLTTNTSANLPFCGSNSSLYSTLSIFCDAQYSDKTLTITDDTCSNGTCTEVLCCLSGCTGGLPVIVFDGTDFIAVDSACVAYCNSHEIIYTCTATTLTDCNEEFPTACFGYCDTNSPSSELTFCDQNSGFYTANQYCIKYLCPLISSLFTFTVHPSCILNDCDVTECHVAQCVLAECSNESSDPVCGVNGNVYDNTCILNCNKDTSRDLCSVYDNAAGCEAECEYLACNNSLCTDEDTLVCGTDNETYDNKCLAARAGTDVRFTCPLGCDNIVRSNRCKFDCKNGRTFTEDEFDTSGP